MVDVGLNVFFGDIFYVLMILVVGMVVGLILLIIVFCKLKIYEIKDIFGVNVFLYMKKSLVIVVFVIVVLFGV